MRAYGYLTVEYLGGSECEQQWHHTREAADRYAAEQFHDGYEVEVWRAQREAGGAPVRVQNLRAWVRLPPEASRKLAGL